MISIPSLSVLVFCEAEIHRDIGFLREKTVVAVMGTFLGRSSYPHRAAFFLRSLTTVRRIRMSVRAWDRTALKTQRYHVFDNDVTIKIITDWTLTDSVLCLDWSRSINRYVEVFFQDK